MSEISAKVSSHYDDIADVYDQRYDHRERGKAYYKHISEAVISGLPKGKKLLDIGCGTGLFVHHYLANGGEVVGIDISQGMALKAAENIPKCNFLVGNAELLPFQTESFDALSSLLAFSYLQNPDEMLKDSIRVLKPGGSISLCTLGKNVFTSGLPAVYQLGEKMRIRRVGVGSFNENYYSENEMYKLFSDAGFEDIVVRRCSFAHFQLADPIFQLAQKVEPFIEEKIPYLAYNIIASGKKPEKF